MKTNNGNIKAIEKAFSSYAKSCLQHAKKDYDKKISRQYAYMVSLDTVTFDFNINFIPQVYASSKLLNDLLLLQTLQQLPLKDKEKKIIYFKYYEDKTDRDIAQILGMTRQAVSKIRAEVLAKLKKEMEP